MIWRGSIKKVDFRVIFHNQKKKKRTGSPTRTRTSCSSFRKLVGSRDYVLFIISWLDAQPRIYRGLLDVDTSSAPFFEVSIRRSNIKTWSPNKVSLFKKKKPSDNGFFYVTVAAYFDKQGEIDRSSRLAIKNRWVVAKEIINLLKKISKLSDNHFLRFTGATYLDNILARPSFNAAFVSSPV